MLMGFDIICCYADDERLENFLIHTMRVRYHSSNERQQIIYGPHSLSVRFVMYQS